VTAEASLLLSQVSDLQRAGRPVTALCVGEPDFETPDAVRAAAKRAIDAGRTKYAPLAGIHELREAACRKLKRDNELDYEVDQIVASTGGKQVIYNAFMATVDPGDEVIVPSPYWAAYPDLVRICGGVPIVAETRQDENYILQPETLAANITNNTRWLILNSPNNPTGAVYGRDHLESLASVLRSHPDIWILSDDIYEHIVFGDTAFVTLAQIAPDLSDRTLIVNGCSKGYAMTGWRLGFGAGHRDLITEMIQVQSQVTLAPSTVSQWAAITALEEGLSLKPEQLAVLNARRDLAAAIMNRTEGLHCDHPNGAFYIYVNCADALGKATPDGQTITSDRALCNYLLSHADVAVMPGSAYGLSPYFRLSYAVDTDELRAACFRIEDACTALR
jgi:aspartate aminotransferase